MDNTKNHKKHRVVLGVLLIIAITVGSIGTAVFGSRFAGQLEANVLRTNRVRRANRLVGQLQKLRPAVEDPSVCLFVVPETPEYKGEFVTGQTRAQAAFGGDFEAAFYLKNTGNMPWFSDSSGCAGVNAMRLGTAKNRDRASVFYNPADNRWHGSNRISMLERRVDPGETATFVFRGLAPQVNDIFREYFQPVIEGVKWFEEKQETAYVDVYVGEIAPENESKLLYLNQSGQTSSLNLNGESVVHVDISEQKLTFQIGETLVREYSVSTGTFKTPTPLGNFRILSKEELRIGNKAPHYRMPKWQHFSGRGHGFHSLPYLANDKGVFWKEALNHIGRRVSHGCIRLLPEDAEELYNLTTIGTKVHVHA